MNFTVRSILKCPQNVMNLIKTQYSETSLIRLHILFEFVSQFRPQIFTNNQCLKISLIRTKKSAIPINYVYFV